MKKNMSAKMIKKAIDSYPGGICFSALDGRVILVNEKMNQLVLELTGHTILNAKAAWEELTNFANNDKAEKLTQSWLPKDTDKVNGSTHQQLFFRFFDSSVWRFLPAQRRTVREHHPAARDAKAAENLAGQHRRSQFE